MCKRHFIVLIMLAALTASAQQATPATPAAPATPAPAPTPKLKTRAAVRPAPAAAPEAVVAGRGSSYLGVDIDDITRDRATALKLREERGVEVTLVDQDAPAGKAGVKVHDVIVAFNSTPVESVEQMRRFIRETPPGRTVSLGIMRDGQQINLPVQLGEKRKIKEKFKNDRAFRFEMPNIPPIPHMDFDIPQFTVVQTLSRSGVVVESLTPQLGEFFGVKNGEGVLVRSVEKGSPGESAGLRAGDVIVRVGNERVGDMTDWRRAIRANRSGGTVQIGIVRDKREQNVSMTLPERRTPDQSSLDFELPDFDINLDEISAEMQKLQPKIQQAIQTAQVEFQRDLSRELRQASKELEKAQRDMAKQIRQQMREAGREIDRAVKEMEKEH